MELNIPKMIIYITRKTLNLIKDVLYIHFYLKTYYNNRKQLTYLLEVK